MRGDIDTNHHMKGEIDTTHTCEVIKLTYVKREETGFKPKNSQ